MINGIENGKLVLCQDVHDKYYESYIAVKLSLIHILKVSSSIARNMVSALQVRRVG